MTVKQRLSVWCGAVVVGLMLIGSGQPAAQANQLPPRATLTPVSQSQTHDSRGTYIELRLPTDNINLWTVVQWQDHAGKWRDVESWRGVLDSINNHVGDKIWWVLPGEFGIGPVRWLVYDRIDGKLLATSRTFYLPDGVNRHVIVEVVLK
jgi:hypothetical protein